MPDLAHYLDQVFFTVMPYVAVLVCLIISIQRYRAQTFTFSSLSSQFLENREHFWAMVPFHYGVLVVVFGHVAAFLVPSGVLLWNRAPLRLYILETTGLAFGLLTLIGLLAMTVRRVAHSKLRMVTSPVDWVLLALLLTQMVSGVTVALFHPWGSSWFAASITPYIWSILKFQPDISYVAGMPFLVKFHIVNAFVVIGLFPFTRLVHILIVPNPYLWRKFQVVRWYRNVDAPTPQPGRQED